MTLTPYRDAALKSVQLAEERYAALGTKDPVRVIGEAMNVETCRAVLLGAADMLDRDVPIGRITAHVDECLARAVASVALTIAQGHEPTAWGIAHLCVLDLSRRVEVLIIAARTQDFSSTATPSKCEGRA